MILLQLHFTPDAAEEPLELYHKLKLYGEDDPSGQASVKKPVSSLKQSITFHSGSSCTCGYQLLAYMPLQITTFSFMNVKHTSCMMCAVTGLLCR